MAQRKAKSKPKSKPKPELPEEKAPVVTFNIGAQTYQIDTGRQKVYRRFVEIETAKAFEIYASWRAASGLAS